MFGRIKKSGKYRYMQVVHNQRVEGKVRQQAHGGTRFISGARMRAVKETRDEVVSRPGRYEVVHGLRKNNHDPAPWKAKELRVGERRYIVCHNEEQAEKDKAGGEAIIAAPGDRLKRGDNSLVGNKGCRRCLKTVAGQHFVIDEEKVPSESRFDGKWVLQTDTSLSAQEVALKYKELWIVVAPTAPSQHQVRAAYPSRLPQAGRDHSGACVLWLFRPDAFEGPHAGMEARGWRLHWDRLRGDLDTLEEIAVRNAGKTFVIRTRPQGEAGKAIQAARAALGPTVRLSGQDAPDREPIKRRKGNVVPSPKSKITTPCGDENYQIAV